MEQALAGAAAARPHAREPAAHPSPSPQALPTAVHHAVAPPSSTAVRVRAQCYPYTFTKLQRYLGTLMESRHHIVRRETLTLSSGRNACELLTVSDFNCDPAELQKIVQDKLALYRVHHETVQACQGHSMVLARQSTSAAKDSLTFTKPDQPRSPHRLT